MTCVLIVLNWTECNGRALKTEQTCINTMSANDRNESGNLISRTSTSSGVKSRKPYKVVLESVTQEKKKLVSSVRRLTKIGWKCH